MQGLIAVGVALFAPTQTEASATFKTSLVAYRECVRLAALQFERAKEPVLDTVTVAFAACDEARAGHLFAILDMQKAAGQSDPSIQKADDSTKQLIDEGLRNELIVRLMKLRAASR